jgi:hypothetical protein
MATVTGTILFDGNYFFLDADINFSKLIFKFYRIYSAGTKCLKFDLQGW